jgi:tetratricopeptide (TPR) repeat protein
LTLQVNIPGRSATLSFPEGESLVAHTCAFGMRIQSEKPEEDYVCSCFKLDASTLIVEADDRLLRGISDEQMESTDTESNLVISSGQHHLVVVINRQNSPSRMVMLAGAGDKEGLLTMARSHLHESAHARIGAALAEFDSGQSEIHTIIDPNDYVRSRFRPASPTMPFPWLADAEDEPIWDLGHLYVLFNALIVRDQRMAASLLLNVVETIQPDGSLPVAGGNASPVFYGSASYPIMMRMILLYFQRTGEWPFDLEPKVDVLTRYLHHAINQLIDRGDGENPGPLYLTLIHNEVAIWREIHLVAGKPLDRSIRDINLAYNEISNRQPKSDNRDDIEWLALIDRRHPATERIRTVAKFTQGIYHELIADDNPAWWTFALIVLEELSTINHQLHTRWLNDMYTISKNKWDEFIATASRTHEVDYPSKMMVIAGFLTWIRVTDISRTPSFIFGFLTWLNRRRNWLALAAAFMILAAGLFVIRVQFRPTMTDPEFRTKIGLIMQEYKAGNYDHALIILNMMEKKGGHKNPYVNFLKGQVLYQNKNFREAADYFELVTRQSQDNANAYFNLGLCYFRAGEYSKSRKTFAFVNREFSRSNPTLGARARIAEEIVSQTENFQTVSASSTRVHDP